MDFEFSEDQLGLRDNVRSVLSAECPLSLVRAVAENHATGEDLWGRLVALDWPALGIAEEHGGLGHTFVEVAIVVEELGRCVAPSPFMATVPQFAALVRETGNSALHARILSEVAEGSLTGTVAVAENGSWEPSATHTAARPGIGGGWVISGTKSYVLDGATVDEFAVVARRSNTTGEEGLGVFLVPRADAAVRLCEVIDPTVPVAEVTFDEVVVAPDRVLLEPGDPAAARAVRRALEEATTAMALSTTATCRAIFEMTLQYAKDREQFGRPIGSFQALKHRLAEMYIAVERANTLAYFAALTIAEDDDRRGIATAMAKAAAGDCQRLVVKDGLQLHGGIGFTWENDLHLLLKRAKSGDALFGNGATHRAQVGAMLGLTA